ncbi:tryptophan--tRNA ligase [Candidatus Curtissbacteria bacterium RIFCSPLOWO2_01_FULL_42_26]|uniref:Tryptophan--tRNA ligase n=1 Tax=Candidatus Curtissbacteria bacterium RIFCSPLOWO2_01_FULL_42_26 TaxID=1797729 RepID=A0A1F5HVD6_9BACT|nr:MAG: tryptophan--tRNA ligase [Candidatus Curtissbacteria bacterium RIFCSPLOWO2_01_FULL_42_26]
MKKRILTGDRPTLDSFHLGNYVGSLKNRVKLQDEYETFIEVVDLHALTTHFDKTDSLKENIRGLVLGYLSVGLDPAKVTFFLQSKVPEILEIAYFLSILTPRPLLARQPALKEKLDQGEQDTVGLFYYPVLMAADILAPRANLVPVGKDQKAHVEYARDIAQKFNDRYGEVFPIPEPLIGEVETLPGTDGQAKMGKSLGNAIFLTDISEEVNKKVMGMYTDPKRIHGDEPGDVDGNPVFIYLDSFKESKSQRVKVDELKDLYQKGQVKDVEVKEFLVEVLEEFLAPIRNRRTQFEKQPDLVEKILKVGTEKARAEAQKTLTLVKKAMKIDYF